MKIWLDDIREAPRGYILCHSVNEAKRLIEEHEKQTAIEVIDCDHDLEITIPMVAMASSSSTGWQREALIIPFAFIP